MWHQLTPTQVATNGIELRVFAHGQGPAVVLAHGFPELAFSWRHQIFALADAGYRVIVPDMRGYGGSSRPAEVEAYDVFTLAADLIGLLDAEGQEQAVFVGHDWGASVVWHLALAYPGRTKAVAGLSVPPTRRSAAPPTQIMRKRLGDDFYMLRFQEPEVPEDELFAFLRDFDVDGVYAETFRATGFTGGLNYYRNLDRNWALAERFQDRTIDVPALFVIGSEDPVGSFMRTDRITEITSDLRGHVVIDGAGHWIQQERPDEVNTALLRFLDTL
ncbi:alpha/beta fold hydrolase [Nonomuraea sp. KM90]|uniref:alpha/beta fold hydrolase n=1 Tax=Nonomuraea sp. KM90 TaxID=3457428 RepID=UPI003FCE0060